MSKQKYIAVLTEGALEQGVIDALTKCSYELKRESDYGGNITHHYEKKCDDESETSRRCKNCFYRGRDWFVSPCGSCCRTKVPKINCIDQFMENVV